MFGMVVLMSLSRWGEKVEEAINRIPEPEPLTISEMITVEARRAEVELTSELLIEWVSRRLSSIFKGVIITCEYDEMMCWYILKAEYARQTSEKIVAFEQVRDEQIGIFSDDTHKWANFMDTVSARIRRVLSSKLSDGVALDLNLAMDKMGKATTAAGISLASQISDIEKFNAQMKSIQTNLEDQAIQAAIKSIKSVGQ